MFCKNSNTKNCHELVKTKHLQQTAFFSLHNQGAILLHFDEAALDVPKNWFIAAMVRGSVFKPIAKNLQIPNCVCAALNGKITRKNLQACKTIICLRGLLQFC